MPKNDVVHLATARGQLLGDWALDRAAGGPLAGHDHALVPAFAGAGKSYHLTRAVHRAIGSDARILIVAGTNDQVRDLARRLHALGLSVLHFAATGQEIPSPPPGLISGNNRQPLRTATCVVATVYQAGKLAKNEPTAIGTFDLGFVDEAFQVATSSEALNALTLADRWAFVGDSGQIAVFTRLGVSPFLGPDDPVTSIVASAQAQGCDLGQLEFDWTWRLPDSGAPMLTPFYGRTVRSAAEPADRLLAPGPRRAQRGLARVADDCVDRAATLGWGYLELSGDPLEAADPETGEGIAAVVTSLLTRNTAATCERDGNRPLDVPDIGVIVATDAQRGVAEQALATAGYGAVDVRTYNRAQGLEFAVSVLWHPLSGAEEVNDFSLDLGRLCVGVSRHRQACVLVGQRGLRSLLEDPPLSPEAPWPGERDRFLAGWLAHAHLVEELDRIGATVAA